MLAADEREGRLGCGDDYASSKAEQMRKQRGNKRVGYIFSSCPSQLCKTLKVPPGHGRAPAKIPTAVPPRRKEVKSIFYSNLLFVTSGLSQSKTIT